MWSHLPDVLTRPRAFSGYDSDVAREKAVDYVTKIYSASIRNMSGTRPHLQHKELVVEDRYSHFDTPAAVIALLRYQRHSLGCPPQAASEPSGATARQAAKEQHVQEEEGGGGGSRPTSAKSPLVAASLTYLQASVTSDASANQN